MLILTIINHDKISRHAKIIFALFFLLPFLGMILQTISSNLFFAWSSISLSILVVYIFIECSSTEKDYLTQLYSRQTYEKYVMNLIETHQQFGVVLIDLDNFKDINDQLGHYKGDRILEEFSRILEKCFYPNEMISRLAGDEFLIVFENNEDIDDYIDNVKTALKESRLVDEFSIDFSYGYQVHKPGMNMDDLYMDIDKFMYKNKNIKKG